MCEKRNNSYHQSLIFPLYGSKPPEVARHQEMSMTATQLPEIDAYRSHVETLAVKLDGETVLNRSPEHAGVIIEWVFNSSSEIVQILTSRLAEEVYCKQPLIEAAIKFLQRPHARIEILAETDIDCAGHLFLRAIDDSGFGDKLSLSVLPKPLQERYHFNFALGDGKNFRFEESRLSFDALARFGAADVGNKLQLIFNDLKRLCLVAL
jgi:hypothetical protein